MPDEAKEQGIGEVTHGHSGAEHLGMNREDHPEGISFGGMTVEEAVTAGLITVKDEHMDPRLMPEHVAEIYDQPAQLPPVEHRIPDGASRSPAASRFDTVPAQGVAPKSKKKIIGVLVGGITLLGIGLGIGMSSEGEEEPTDPDLIEAQQERDETASDTSIAEETPNVTNGEITGRVVDLHELLGARQRFESAIDSPELIAAESMVASLNRTIAETEADISVLEEEMRAEVDSAYIPSESEAVFTRFLNQYTGDLLVPHFTLEHEGTFLTALSETDDFPRYFLASRSQTFEELETAIVDILVVNEQTIDGYNVLSLANDESFEIRLSRDTSIELNLENLRAADLPFALPTSSDPETLIAQLSSIYSYAVNHGSPRVEETFFPYIGSQESPVDQTVEYFGRNPSREVLPDEYELRYRLTDASPSFSPELGGEIEVTETTSQAGRVISNEIRRLGITPVTVNFLDGPITFYTVSDISTL